MRRTLGSLGWVTLGTLLTIVTLELMLSALPVSGRGMYGAELDSNWPMHHLLPNGMVTYSAGWNLSNVHESSINNMGYVAPFNYEYGSTGVVVLGDSYIESLMNSYGQTLQGRLPGLLKTPHTVMQFANSGGSMPDYLAVGKLVGSHFKPTSAVVVLSEGDFVEGFSENRGYYSWNIKRDPPVELAEGANDRSLFVKWVRRSALVRYIRYNLKMDLSRLIHVERVMLAEEGEVRGCDQVSLSTDDSALASSFIRLLPQVLKLDPSNIVLVFDSDRKLLYGPGEVERSVLCPTRDKLALMQVRNEGAAAGMHVVDTKEIFPAYYHATGRRVDYSPVDWHWNGEAHRLVADRVADILNH